ncbi:unnamed protein product [Ophioblennius macclurei]
MAVQKKQSVVPPSQGPLSTRTIENLRKGNRSQRIAENGSYSKPETQTKGAICSFNKSAQILNTLSPRAAAANGQNVDERLKAARERREEHQKLLASREMSRLEREQRARRYYEQQLQERKKKLSEQRQKEERRRAAVEEKRKQRLREEKERCESAVRRTLEKSQKAQQVLSQITRGRKLSKNVSRRLPLTTWEKNLVSRLLTPTCSYLARSKSVSCQSGQEVSFHSMNTTATIHKPQHHSGSVHHRSSASPSANNSRLRSIGVSQMKTARQQDIVKKTPSSGSHVRSTSIKSSPQPATVRQKKPASPSPERTRQRSISRHSTPMQLELPSVPEEDAAVCTSALSPGNTRPVRKSHEGQPENMRKENPPETPSSNLPNRDKEAHTRTEGNDSPSKAVAHLVPQAPEVMSRPSAGTTDPNEALRLLAEKRREARLQREKEEQERLQKEEAERRSREELERRRAEERARQEAEAQRLVEEKRRREEEEQRRAEEERAQAMREAALLQKQREEELAKERAQAEKMKQERELIAQKEEAERQARKKRLEEIMRRTRRTDSPDTKSVPARILPNEAKPKENTEPVLNINKVEEAIKLPVGTKTTQLGLNNDEDMVPVVAFKERRSLRTLTGLDEIQTHQRAEVI